MVGANKSLYHGLVDTAVGRHACYLAFCKVFWFFDTTSGAADIEIGGDTYDSVWFCFFFPPRSMALLLLNIHGGLCFLLVVLGGISLVLPWSLLCLHFVSKLL